MRPIQLPPQSPEPIEVLEEVYHTTQGVRLRTRSQMMPLATERQMVTGEIAAIVREDEQTVRRWM